MPRDLPQRAARRPRGDREVGCGAARVLHAQGVRAVCATLLLISLHAGASPPAPPPRLAPAATTPGAKAAPPAAANGAPSAGATGAPRAAANGAPSAGASKPPPAAVARGAPAGQAAKAAPTPVWIGVFDPRLPAHAPWGTSKLTPIAHGGVVRVLAPADGPAASGEVVIAHVLLGKTASGTVDRGTVELADFAFDQRDGDDGVVVLPGKTAVAFVAPSAVEASAIKAVLLRTDALAGVRRALAGLELGAIDVDADGKADVAVTYGCATWFDGSCQAHGQFVLARRGTRWVIVE